MTAREIPTDADWIAGLVHLGLTEQEAADALERRTWLRDEEWGDHWAEDRADNRTGGTHWRDEAEDRAMRRRGR